LNILYKIKYFIKDKRMNFFLGNYMDCESVLLLKKLSNKYGNYSINSNNQNNINNNFRKDYLFNNNLLNNLEDFNNILLVGLNLRIENPLLHLKLKNMQRKNIFKIFNIGLNYNYSLNTNNSSRELKRLIEGKSYFCNILQKGKGLILINNNLKLPDLDSYLSRYLKNFFYININNNTTSLITNEFNLINSINNFNDFSFKNNIKNFKGNINYFINTDNLIYNNLDNYSIYQGQYLNDINLLKYFNILLPSVNYLEKNANYINFFGYVQNINFVIFPPKKARSD
jgi:NADH-quinone oxidoreductase subunit G